MGIIKKILFLLLVLAIILFTVRFFLLDRLTTIALQKAGAKDISVHLSTLGFKQSHIDILAATFKLPTGAVFPVTLKNISLQYSLQQLLTTGKCHRVTIETMEISRTGTLNAPKTSLRLPNQISLLKDDLRTHLPLEELRIEQLRLHGDLPPQLTDRGIELDAAVKGTAIIASITFQMNADSLLSIDLQSTDSIHGTAVIIGRQNRNEILQAGLELKPDGLSGTVDLQLRPVRDLLLQAVDITGLPEINGRLNGNFTLPLPLSANSTVQAEITLRDSEDHKFYFKAEGNPNTKQLSLVCTGRKKEQEFLNTVLAVQDQRISGSYSLHATPLRSLLKPYLQQPLPEITGKLSGRLDLPLPENIDKNFTATVLATTSALPGFSCSSAQVQLAGKVKDRTIFLGPDSEIHAKGITLGKTGVEALSLDLTGNFKQVDDRFLLDFAGRKTIQIKGLTTGKLHIDDIHLQPQKPLQISIHKNFWSLTANTLHFSPLMITEGPRSYTTGPLTCRFSSLENYRSGILLSSEIETPAVVYQDKTLRMPLKNLSGTVLLKDNRFSGTLHSSPENIDGRVKANFDHDLAAAAGSFTLRTDRLFDLNQEEVSLSKLFTPWRLPFDLDSGMVSFKADGTWAPHKDFNLSAFVTVTGGSGYFKRFLFKGLDTRQDLAVLPRLHSKTEGSFSLQQLIGGIDVHNARANLNFLPAKTGKLPQIHINNFSASLFEGTITSPTITYDLNHPDSNFTVDIKTMNLETMVKLIKMDNLHVTGRINGTVPVTIKGKDISVEKGELYNEPPGGEIRYTADNMNPAGITGYALKAVENFQYDSLKTTARYAPSGQLDLDIGLQGSSPELESNRPVHLNIHAEQNLPALLQSLRFSKGLTEKLDKRLKQHYK